MKKMLKYVTDAKSESEYKLEYCIKMLSLEKRKKIKRIWIEKLNELNHKEKYVRALAYKSLETELILDEKMGMLLSSAIDVCDCAKVGRKER